MSESSDPTFYRSPAAAIAAPPEKLAYVAAFDPAGEQRDAMTVIDCDAGSSTLRRGGRLDGAADRRQRAASLRLERLLQRALPRGPRGRARAPLPDRARASARRAPTCSTPSPTRASPRSSARSRPRSSPPRPATRARTPCTAGPAASSCPTSAAPTAATGPGGVALIDHDTFEVTGAWETDRGEQHFAYDVWWHLNDDVAITSEWATPSMIEDGLNPEDLLGKRFGHHLDFWSLSEGKLIQRIDLGDEHQMVLELRPAHDPAQDLGLRRRGDQRRGPVRLGVAVAPRRRPLGGRRR